MYRILKSRCKSAMRCSLANDSISHAHMNGNRKCMHRYSCCRKSTVSASGPTQNIRIPEKGILPAIVQKSFKIPDFVQTVVQNYGTPKVFPSSQNMCRAMIVAMSSFLHMCSMRYSRLQSNLQRDSTYSFYTTVSERQHSS